MRATAGDTVESLRERSDDDTEDHVVRLYEDTDPGGPRHEVSGPGSHVSDGELAVRLTSVIAAAVRAEQVHHALVEVAGKLLGASSAALFVREEDAARVALVRSYGYSPAASLRFRSVALVDDPVLPGLHALSRAEGLFIAREELERSFPALAESTTGRCERCRCVPLIAGGEALGSLAFTFADATGDEHEEERLLAVLGHHGACALERLRRFESESRRRMRAEAEAARVAALNRIAELLYGLARLVIAAESTDEVLEPSLDAIMTAVQADRAAVLLCDGTGVMRFRAWRGLSEGYRAAVEGHSPWPRDARSPEPVVIADTREAPALAQLLDIVEGEGIRALSFIPLVTEGRILGKFMVYFDAPRELTRQELDVASAIANHVAAAVARLEAVAELRHTLRFNEMFTGMLGHDLRNPLSAILTAAQLAMKRADDERLQKPLGRIVNGGRRMARMIDQLLDFTRVRVGGGIPLAPRPIDIVPLLREIVEDAEDVSGTSIALEAQGPSVGDWDRERLGQVFANLVGNALSHGESGVPARVRVDGTDPRSVCVEVVNGGTIPPDLVAKLFEPMMGGDGRRQKSQGLGLGLFISKQIVRAHGGTIDVRSAGAGETAFHVVLPRAAQTAPGQPI